MENSYLQLTAELKRMGFNPEKVIKSLEAIPYADDLLSCEFTEKCGLGFNNPEALLRFDFHVSQSSSKLYQIDYITASLRNSLNAASEVSQTYNAKNLEKLPSKDEMIEHIQQLYKAKQVSNKFPVRGESQNRARKKKVKRGH